MESSRASTCTLYLEAYQESKGFDSEAVVGFNQYFKINPGVTALEVSESKGDIVVLQGLNECFIMLANVF